LGGLPDALKHLGVDVHPKQIPVRDLALGRLPTKPEIIFVRLNQEGQSVRDRLDEQALRVLCEVAEHHRSLFGRLSIEDQHLDALVTVHLRATLLRGPSAAPEGLRLEATLRAQASLITYRRRYQAGARYGRTPTAIQNPAGPSPNAPSRPHADHVTDRPSDATTTGCKTALNVLSSAH